MKSLLLFTALFLPSLGFSATLTGSVVDSSASVNLASVGTLDWARWTGYTNKAGLISDIKVTGTLATYANDRRIIGDRKGVRVSGSNAGFELTVPATTSQRTLIYYIGGWNSTGRVTVTLPGAPTYTVNVQRAGTYSRVVTIKFKGDAAGPLRVRYTQVAGHGSINMQAAALQGTNSPPAPPPVSGSAVLTWTAPTKNANGTPLADLSGFKVYWGTTQGSYPNSFRINSLSARTYTVTGLPAGRWYFAVTALAATGQESAYSNAASKLIQ